MATKCITKNKPNDKGLNSIVPIVVQSPTKESISSPLSPSQSKTITKPPARQIRHVSKAALEVIGKIVHFEQTLKEKLLNFFVLDKTGISLSCSSGNDRSIYIPIKSTIQTNNTMHSRNDIKSLFEITIPELFKMIKNKSFNQNDDNVLTDMSDIEDYNDSFDDTFSTNHTNTSNNSSGSKTMTIEAESQHNNCAKTSHPKMKHVKSLMIKIWMI